MKYVPLALAVTGLLAAVACAAPNPLGDYASREVDAGSVQGSNAGGNGDNGGGDGTGSPGPHNPGSTPSPIHLVDAAAPSPQPIDPDASAGVTPTEDGATPTPDAAPSADAAPPSDGGGSSSALLQHCVDDVNSARSQLGLPPLARSSALEAYAGLAASSDAQSGTTHGYYDGNGGNGVSSGEAELPGWPLSQYASLSDLIDQGVTAIVNQGPGVSPYDDLASTQFTQVGCGSSTTADGNAWVTFDFH